jgi:hypothetical protein
VARSTIYRLLGRHGWRKVVPRPRHPKTDLAAQSAFKKLRPTVRQEVLRQAKRGRRLRLMLQEEARFGLLGTHRRCWTPHGIRPVVSARLERKYIYALSAVSPHDGVMDSIVLPWVNAHTMSLFLAEVAQRHIDEFVLMVTAPSPIRLSICGRRFEKTASPITYSQISMRLNLRSSQIYASLKPTQAELDP